MSRPRARSWHAGKQHDVILGSDLCACAIAGHIRPYARCHAPIAFGKTAMKCTGKAVHRTPSKANEDNEQCTGGAQGVGGRFFCLRDNLQLKRYGH